MAGIIQRAASYLGGLFTRRKSAGERKLVSLLPGWNIMGRTGSWSANRHELVGHFKGWNYISIRTIAETGADMPPSVAMVETAGDAEKARQKAWFSTRDPFLRAKRMAKLQAKYLRKDVRRKALVNAAQDDELIPVDNDHRLMRLLLKPNNVDKFWWTFSYRMFMYLELAGGFYLWAVPGGDGLPAELWCLPPNWVYPVTENQSQFISHYEMRPVAGYSWTEGGAPGWIGGGIGGDKGRVPADQIVQVGYPNPVHYLDFYSPISAVAEWIDAAENMDRSRVAVFQNASFPGVIITMTDEVDHPDQPTIDRLKADIKNKYAGVLKSGEPIILAPGMEMQPVTRTNLEMDYVNSFEQSRKSLMAVHKVGAGKIGMSEATTLASMVAEDIGFHKTTMRPKFSLLGQALTAGIASKFDPRLRIYWPDPTPDDPAQVNADIEADYRCQAITPNEIRRKRGREAYANGGDDPMASMGISPLPFQTGMEAEDAIIPVLEQQGQDAAKEQQQGGGGMPGMPGLPGMNGQPSMNGNGNPIGNGNGHPTTEKPLADIGKRWSGNGWARHDDLGVLHAEIAEINKRFDAVPEPVAAPAPVHNITINNKHLEQEEIRHAEKTLATLEDMPSRIVKGLAEVMNPNIVVNVPEQAAPVVNVNVPAPVVNVNVPEIKIPEQTIEINVPEQAAPTVNAGVSADELAGIIELLTKPKTKSVVRDANGDIVKVIEE